jgi:hypothetical protein
MTLFTGHGLHVDGSPIAKLGVCENIEHAKYDSSTGLSPVHIHSIAVGIELDLPSECPIDKDRVGQHQRAVLGFKLVEADDKFGKSSCNRKLSPPGIVTL